MTRLRVATWNVHEGVPVKGRTLDPFSSFWADLADRELDVAALQEVCFPASGGVGDLAIIAEKAGLTHFAHFPLSASHLREGQLAGLALLSRHPIRDRRRVTLPNLGLRHEHDGMVVDSHDKGSLSAVVEVNGEAVRVASVHAPPFHRFGRDAEEFEPIWAALARSLSSSDDLPLLVGGDFNTANRELFTREFRRPLQRAIGDQDTHCKKAADDILFTEELSLELNKVIPTQSDHALCLAEFEFRQGR